MIKIMRTSILTFALVLACAGMVSINTSAPAGNVRLQQQEEQDPLIGKRFLDVSAKDANGKTHKLSQYAGKGQWVLVDFWASWCGPCEEEMPNVVAAYRKYHDKGFEIVGFSLDESKEDWLEALDSWNMTWINLSDLKGWGSAASQRYGIEGIPDNVLIDPDGTVVARDLRGDDLSDYLSSIFN